MLTASPTQLGICNQALARCGIKQFITSLDPAVDSSQEAAMCKLFWDPVRQRLLSGFPWKFAQRQAQLEAFTPRSSSVALSGSGPSDFIYGVGLSVSANITTTYDCMLEVTTSGAATVGRFRASVDGGVTWGAPVTFSGPGVVIMPLGSTVPIGSGLAMTAGDVALSVDTSKTIVDGDIYRFTVTDGLSKEFACAYELPDDLLTARYVYPGTRSPRADQRVPWKRGSFADIDVLWMDVGIDASPTLVYVEDVIDCSRFTPGFVDAMAWKLATEIAPPLKAKPEPNAEQKFLFAVNEARAIDFVESQEDQPPDSPTIAARGYSWLPYGVGELPPMGGWYPY